MNPDSTPDSEVLREFRPGTLADDADYAASWLGQGDAPVADPDFDQWCEDRVEESNDYQDAHTPADQE